MLDVRIQPWLRSQGKRLLVWLVTGLLAAVAVLLVAGEGVALLRWL